MAAPIPDSHHWLVKSEPESYGIDHLKADKKTAWTGVRNFLARNYMQQGMHKGDLILFYHSSCKVPGVYGLAKVASAAYPDPSQFDKTNAAGKENKYFEPRAVRSSSKDGGGPDAKPVWFCVDIAFVKKFKEPVTITDIRANPKLRSMMILQPGSRLSITPVSEEHFTEIVNSMVPTANEPK
jgi:predicted RNA-binding protein with PUA-like domain